MGKTAVRTVSIESLKVDIKFGPVEDKIEQLFTLIFSIKGDSSTQWETNYRFSKFADLNKQLNHAAPNFISTDFPKAHRSRAALGIKIADDKLEERRNVLNLWLREVIANYDLLSGDIRDVLIDFIKVPNFLNLTFATRDQIEEEEFKSTSETNGTTIGNGHSTQVKRNSVRKSMRTSFTQPVSMPEKIVTKRRDPIIRKHHKVSSLFLNARELVEIIYDYVSVVHTLKCVNSVVCVTRSERLIKMSSRPIVVTVLEDVFWSYGFRYWLIIVIVLFVTAQPADYRFALPSKLLAVSLVSLFAMWYHDQDRMYRENIQITLSNNGSVLQQQVGEFVQHLHVRYTEFVGPCPGAILRRMSYNEAPPETAPPPLPPAATTQPQASTSSKLGNLFTPMKKQASTGESAAPAAPAHATSPQQSSQAAQPQLQSLAAESAPPASPAVSATPPNTAVKIFPPVEEPPAGPTPKEIAEAAKKAMLAARKEFDEFEFTDLAPAARAMYIDRKFTHNFQVRGPTYLDDKKKVHPGSAMCKLMLLELYEVETKDGDRHDHIASRGLAKKRRERIAALPGNPFQFIINFQIPGDPPVSIVTYFALPPDLADRYPPHEIEKFMALFGRFINLPVNEVERLATWGVVSKAKKINTDGSTDDSHDNESEGETETHSVAAAPAEKSSGWMKMPSDISWPDPHEPGGLPPADFRNMRFKLIPSVTEGPWVVKAAVRSQPALLGRKVVQRYFRGDNYMEIDIHVGSSVIASQIVGVCRGYGKHFAADVGIVIQGEDASELAEKVLGCCSFHKIDMDVRQKLGD